MPKSRKPATQRPFKTLRIFCEGEKTEPGYLKSYLATLDNVARKSVIEVEKTRKNTPVQLVDEAVKAKRSPNSLPDDEFWVVYDRESIARYSDALHAKAYDRAQRAGIKVALSNVCFEYWLLLHFTSTDAPYASYADLIEHSALNTRVKAKNGKDYGKADTAMFDLVKEGLTDARTRAARLNKKGTDNADPNRTKPFHINPYVGVVDLLDAIDDFK